MWWRTTSLIVERNFQKSLYITYLPEETGIFNHQIARTKNTVRLCSLKFIHFNGSVFLAMLVAKGVFWQWQFKCRFILVKTGKMESLSYVDCSVYLRGHIHTIPECRSNHCSVLRSSRVHVLYPLLMYIYLVR